MKDHILFAYKLDGLGGGELFDDYSANEPNKSLIWTHLDANHSDTRTWLNKEINFLDPYIVDALLAEETRPRFMQINDGMLIILRGMNPSSNDTPEDMISIRLWIEKHRIISIRKRSLNLLENIVDNIENNKGPKNSADFITTLIAQLCNRMEPVLMDLDDRIIDIEEQVVDKADLSLREAVIEVRKQAIIFRRYIIPQRDAIEQLRLSSLTWLGSPHKRFLVEIYNHVLRYVEDLEEARERAQVVKDELSNALSDRLNRNMYFLSIVAAIFLPLSFLTGLLGINVGGIPGAGNTNAFWIFSVGLLIIVALQVYLFKRFKWL
ncbi:zinc transporter ZntB [Francisellaceae bacterium CB299]|jgi:zinc transporter